MSLKKSTKYHLAVFAAALLLAVALHTTQKNAGCLGAVAAAVATCEGLFLIAKGIVTLFRLIVRRIDLRLAFSYFLIGVVPIPLLTALLFAVAYLLASQFVGTRLRREVGILAELAAATEEGLPEARVEARSVMSSDVDWLAPGDQADWAERLLTPKPLLVGDRVWFAARPDEKDAGRIALLSFSDPSSDYLQRLSERTGYEVRLATGRGERQRSGYRVRAGKEGQKEWAKVARPRASARSQDSWLSRDWLVGVYLEPPVAILRAAASDKRVVVFVGRTSPQVLFGQIFAQGVPEVGRVFWGIIAGVGFSLLLVYLVALAIAFFLVGSIARNVNRLTRAAQAVGRGDFSVRIQSKARDQMGDLTRSFDGMAASIQRLLVETAKKERLEGEIAIAQTIQQKLLPPAEAELPGIRLLAHFQPVAEIGGDYYDYFTMPDGRSAIAVGDVSGHGLPTGLLVAMAKAALTTQIESGLSGPGLFARLNDLMHRSTDSRNYMTLTLLAYDTVSREGELTNAGQLAPYRLSGGELSSLALPSFPLGTSPRTEFPTARYDLVSGDRLLFLTDGFVEAANAAGEPFGFERLEALLKAEGSADAPRLQQSILAAVSEHTGGAPPDDDRTLVILTIE